MQFQYKYAPFGEIHVHGPVNVDGFGKEMQIDRTYVWKLFNE